MRFKRVHAALVPVSSNTDADVTEKNETDTNVTSSDKQQDDDVAKPPAVSEAQDSDVTDDSSSDSSSDYDSESEQEALKPVEEIQLQSDVITASGTGSSQGQTESHQEGPSAESFKEVDEVELSNDVIVVDRPGTSLGNRDRDDSSYLDFNSDMLPRLC